ncbi:MAG: sulfate permease [Bacteroidales bacterium]|nr:sulfate permease [Bacteroidales bacterium]
MFSPKFFTTIKQYDRKTFFSDLTAGIIVGIVALPLAIAFGIASGVSPERGMITAIIAGFLISFLGGSRVQIGGPTGAFIVIIYGIVEQFGVQGLIIATIMAGIMLVAMGFLKLGSVIQFMPYPIVVGFTSGIAVIIFSSQIKDFFGLGGGEVPASFVEKWGFYFENLSTVNLYAFAIAGGTLLVSLLWQKINKVIPGSLVAIVITTVAVYYFQLPVETIGSKFGEIRAGIPAPSIPGIDFSTFRMLLMPAFTIAILGAIESLLSAMVADGATGYRHRPNTELIAQGVANIITPLFGGIPATGAIARTMVNIRNGGKTPMAGIIHAVVLLLILLFLGKLARLIPLATLSGILVIVAYNMSEWRSFKGIFRNSKSDISVLLTTFLLTVFIDLTVAIQFGLLMAVFLFVRRVSETTDIEVLSSQVEDEHSHLSDDEETLEIPAGVEVFQIKGPFFFGIANKFEEAEKQSGQKPKIRIIRMRRVPFIDSTGLKNLKNFIRRSRNQGIIVLISGLQAKPREDLEKEGIVKMLGNENVCPNIELALERAIQLLEKVLSPR